jgi:hypothetical protein
MKPRTRNTLLVVAPVAGASLAASVLFFAEFTKGGKSIMPLAVSAFAVAGLIAIMPWQLAQSVAACGHRDDARNQMLLTSGSLMSVAAILFMAAAVLQYFRSELPDLVADVGWRAVFWLASGFGAVLSLAIAVLCFTLGIVFFSWTLYDVAFRHTDEDGSRQQEK